jgi:transcriptional regulator NrdR family protein
MGSKIKMRCVKCGYEDTRIQNTGKRNGVTFRYRFCPSCRFRFKTSDRLSDDRPEEFLQETSPAKSKGKSKYY